ncbi:MAG: hypothetical protein HOI88_00340 [Phycisphaerae bacterium]|nr:hypothetical protein [Phycisphaerae bacterium]
MKKSHTFYIGVFVSLAYSGVASALSFETLPEPPMDLVVIDTPDDAGNSVELDWALSGTDIFNPLIENASDTDPSTIVATYSIERKVSDANGSELDESDLNWQKVSEAGAGESHWTDRTVERGWTYDYRICSVDNQGDSSTWCNGEPVTPVMQIFNMSKAWLAIFMLIFGGFIAYFINQARAGKPLWVRKIAGLEAIDEAVGRATEMGRPVLFVAGIQDINEIQTLAGLTVLSRVAKTAAEYGAQIEVPTCRSLVMAAARETVEAAYLSAGAPDAYQPDKIHYLTDEQFAFVAGVTGYMVREEPAACIYMGGFYAESLILAETGNHIGAIQVAGTAMPSQLPFFVASCDYTLIGEEFFAASAYLSGDPLQIGSLKGQDYGKFFSVLILVIGIFFASIISLSDSEDGLAVDSLNYINNNMLGSEGLGSFGGGDTDIEGDDS